ncbi:DUF7113 family protein [Halococcus agarilyticus]|uniref:DUF7113 family protein n=1 Tax=Halococcus agarilyticus TaxID=1232219 RepID=UPI00067781C2|nr:hypothetical protein [Halococcus agarilyticus]
MLLIRGRAGGTDLTGTLYERGEDAPSFSGAPDEDAPYVWVCDSFYEVESGGQRQRVGGETVNVAFESPVAHGFETRERAVTGAREHLRTQFARIGVAEADVEVEIVEREPDVHGGSVP